MATEENAGHRFNHYANAEALPEMGSFNDLSSVARALSGEDEVFSHGRLNLSSIQAEYNDSVLREYSEPEDDYGVCIVTSGIQDPGETDLEDLRTDIGLALVPLEDIGYIAAGEVSATVNISGRRHYIVGVSDDPDDYSFSS